jgi:carbamoyl-phosphate synthase large subunit
MKSYMESAIEVYLAAPGAGDKYLAGKEVEVDAVSDGEVVLIPGIMEHVEASRGAFRRQHRRVSGAFCLSAAVEQQVVRLHTRRLAVGLNVRGILNIQFVVHVDGACGRTTRVPAAPCIHQQSDGIRWSSWQPGSCSVSG